MNAVDRGGINNHSEIHIRKVSNAKLRILRLLVERGDEHPVRIVITLANPAGIFQVDELLRHKLQNSSIDKYVGVTVKIEGEMERRLIEGYKL